MSRWKDPVWVKPSELPKDFHGHCWISYKGFCTIYEPTCEIVNNHYQKNTPKYFKTDEGYWKYMDDESYRVMITEQPDTITDEEWR